MKKDILSLLMVAFPKVFNGLASTVFNMVLLGGIGTEQFGAYSLAVVIVTMADATFGAAIDMGVIRMASREGNDPAERGQAETAALLVKLVVCLLVGGILMAWQEELGHLVFREAGHGRLIALIAVTTTGLLMLRSALVSFQVAGRFGLYGCFDLLHSLLRFGVGGLLVLLGNASAETVMMAFAAAAATASTLGIAVVLKTLKPSRRRPGVAGQLMGLAKVYLLTYAVTATISRLDLFMLNQLSSMASVGLFSGAQIFTMIPEMIGSYMAIVASPKIIAYCGEGRFGNIYKIFQYACLGASAIIYAIVYAAVLWYGDLLLYGAHPEVWEIVLWLLPGALVSMCALPMTVPFLMFFRPRFLLIMDCVSLPLVAAGYFFAIKSHGAVGAAMVTSAARMLKATIAHFMVLRVAARGTFEIPARDGAV